jgi:hypothetical protein
MMMVDGAATREGAKESFQTLVMPMTPFNGVLISWDIEAKNIA